MILIGMPEPEDGWLLEEIEAALFQAEAQGTLMPREKFVQRKASGNPADIGGLL